MVRKHYGKWSPARKTRIDDLMKKVHSGANYSITEAPNVIQ